MKTRGLAVAALIAVAACSHRAPSGQMSTAQPQAVAAVAPPEPRAENPGNAPHPGYVWIPGYWNRVNARYVWALGYWTRPPAGFSTWEPARWRHEQSGWVLTRGHWKN